MTDFLKNSCADIICTTKYRNPNYEIIEFQKFLFRKISYVNDFISVDTITSLRNKIIKEYKNDKSCFNEFGTLSEISFMDLYYYQQEVGINGPKHSDIDEPVAILQVDNKFILWNGYHRALIKVLSDKKSIKGYLFRIPD